MRRRRKALEKTLEARPDLLDGVGLDPPEEALLSDLKQRGAKARLKRGTGSRIIRAPVLV